MSKAILLRWRTDKGNFCKIIHRDILYQKFLAFTSNNEKANDSKVEDTKEIILSSDSIYWNEKNINDSIPLVLEYWYPDGNTRIIDKGFQQICLLTKADHIEENIKHGKEVIYSFDNFTYVLSVGFDNNTYEEVEDMNFTELVRLINMEYITCTE